MESGISRDELRVVFEVAYSQTTASLISDQKRLKALSFLLHTINIGNYSNVSHKMGQTSAAAGLGDAKHFPPVEFTKHQSQTIRSPE